MKVAMLALAGDDGGPWQYETAVLKAMKAVDPGISLTRLRARSLRSVLDGELRLPYGKIATMPIAVQEQLMRVAVSGYDLVHRCDLRLPVTRREVLTIHDTAWLHDDDAPTPGRAGLASVRRALAVIAPSRFAAAEIADHLGRHDVDVVHNGVDDDAWHAEPMAAEQLGRLGLDRPFVLCSGGNARRKNLPALLDAWASLRIDRYRLAITGVAANTVRAEGVVPLGLLPRPAFLGVLSASAGVVVPSTYEGFGLPALEGMAAGKPVLATDRASLPEICGDAALICAPQAASLAEGLAALLGDDALRRRLVAAGAAHARAFTWQRSAQAHLDVYSRALASA